MLAEVGHFFRIKNRSQFGGTAVEVSGAATQQCGPASCSLAVHAAALQAAHKPALTGGNPRLRRRL